MFFSLLFLHFLPFGFQTFFLYFFHTFGSSLVVKAAQGQRDYKTEHHLDGALVSQLRHCEVVDDGVDFGKQAIVAFNVCEIVAGRAISNVSS